MKEINVFVRHNDLSRVTDIIQKHKAGITFFDIQGTGRTPRSIPEVVHAYQTGRKTVPRFIGGDSCYIYCIGFNCETIG